MHYGMQGISPQAAAIAATAAASGQGYPYTLPDSDLPQTSPRMGGDGGDREAMDFKSDQFVVFGDRLLLAWIVVGFECCS
jgi:hypothetical protein